MHTVVYTIHTFCLLVSDMFLVTAGCEKDSRGKTAAVVCLVLLLCGGLVAILLWG